jgi:hypothetical protein
MACIRLRFNPWTYKVMKDWFHSLLFQMGSTCAAYTEVKSSRTYTKWKFRPVESAGDGPAIVASQTVYDYLTSFDPGFIESKGQPVTQYTYKLALFKANQTNLDN